MSNNVTYNNESFELLDSLSYWNTPNTLFKVPQTFSSPFNLNLGRLQILTPKSTLVTIINRGEVVSSYISKDDQLFEFKNIMFDRILFGNNTNNYIGFCGNRVNSNDNQNFEYSSQLTTLTFNIYSVAQPPNFYIAESDVTQDTVSTYIATGVPQMVSDGFYKVIIADVPIDKIMTVRAGSDREPAIQFTGTHWFANPLIDNIYIVNL